MIAAALRLFGIVDEWITREAAAAELLQRDVRTVTITRIVTVEEIEHKG